MKEGIHPKSYEITARCVCGNTIETSSTEKSVEVDICSSCHPFCTGTQKFVDEAGRIEKFQKRYGKKSKSKKVKK